MIVVADSFPLFDPDRRKSALGATVAPLSDLLKELPEVSASAVHPKTRFSMDLPGITDKWLKSAGDIQHVVIFGIESHVCVLQTTLDLLDKGIQVHVIKDGVSSCNVGEIDVALERLRDSGAKITTSESILFQLLVDASHPKFKAISGLIVSISYPDSAAPLNCQGLDSDMLLSSAYTERGKAADQGSRQCAWPRQVLGQARLVGHRRTFLYIIHCGKKRRACPSRPSRSVLSHRKVLDSSDFLVETLRVELRSKKFELSRN